MSFKKNEEVDFYVWTDKTRTETIKKSGTVYHTSYKKLFIKEKDTEKKYIFNTYGYSRKDSQQKMVYKPGATFIKNEPIKFKVTGTDFKYVMVDELDSIAWDRIVTTNVVSESNNIAGRVDLVTEALELGLINQNDVIEILQGDSQNNGNLYGIQPATLNEINASLPLTVEMLEEAAQAAIRNFGRG